MGIKWTLVVGLTALLLSSPVPYRTADAAPTAWKDFNWGTIDVGDCVQMGAHVRLNNDGTGEFDSVVYTTHTSTHDVWWSTLRLEDAGGVVLQVLPTQKGPDMSDGNPPPHYNLNYSFTYDAGLYPKVSSLNEFSKC